MSSEAHGNAKIAAFDRDFFGSENVFSRIGEGSLGGKANGLVAAQDILAAAGLTNRPGTFTVSIPRSTVLTTEIFDLFLQRNDLRDFLRTGAPDDRIAHRFLQGAMPTEVIGDLRALIESVHTPLAVRSSSLLEDALFRPFAGVYATKMTPNNQPDATTRFHKLIEAIKLVWASTFFAAARDYRRALERDADAEKMAVIIQAVVGNRHNERFYPEVSGVARSHNFYPFGDAAPADGVVSLALGLGKTIVDGDVAWSFAPTRPLAPPPFASARDMLRRTQLEYWAVNMGPPPAFDPTAETEYLCRQDLRAADYDGTLDWIASTYDAEGDRLFPGTARPGPRVLTFAPLLDPERGFGQVVVELLDNCRRALACPVEIEFAIRLPGPGRASAGELGFLQVRPMVVAATRIEVPDADLDGAGVLVRSRHAMGNGILEIRDIVYVRPEAFSLLETRAIAAEIESVNRRLREEKRPYVLIGFGRWGSADPSLGIPVQWSQISGAKVIVETTLPEMNVDPSQGSHFFHNMTSFEVGYLHVHHDDPGGIDWSWLEGQAGRESSPHVRHVTAPVPLLVKIDGTAGRGGIWHGEDAK